MLVRRGGSPDGGWLPAQSHPTQPRSGERSYEIFNGVAPWSFTRFATCRSRSLRGTAGSSCWRPTHRNWEPAALARNSRARLANAAGCQHRLHRPVAHCEKCGLAKYDGGYESAEAKRTFFSGWYKNIELHNSQFMPVAIDTWTIGKSVAVTSRKRPRLNTNWAPPSKK